jgi:hypothetical protein
VPYQPLKYDRRIVPALRAQQTKHMQVPLIDLRLQYASIREEILSADTRVCDAQQFIMGPDVERMALGIGEGDEVIDPELTGERQHYVVASIAERAA